MYGADIRGTHEHATLIALVYCRRFQKNRTLVEELEEMTRRVHSTEGQLEDTQRENAEVRGVRKAGRNLAMSLSMPTQLL